MLDLSCVIDEKIPTVDPPCGRRISINRQDIAGQLKRLDHDSGFPVLYEDARVQPLRQFRKPDRALRQNDLDTETTRGIDNDIFFLPMDSRLIMVVGHRSKTFILAIEMVSIPTKEDRGCRIFLTKRAPKAASPCRSPTRNSARSRRGARRVVWLKPILRLAPFSSAISLSLVPPSEFPNMRRNSLIKKMLGKAASAMLKNNEMSA